MASTADPSTPQTTRRRTDYVRLDTVKLAPRNPKGHDAVGISRAIAHHGMGELPLLDERTGRLVAGHGRYEQLVDMHAAGKTPPDGIDVDPADGMWLMPVTAGWSSRSDEDAEAYLIGSNELTSRGGWADELQLTEMLGDLAGANLLEVTGYDLGDYEAMDALYSGDPEDPDPDDFDNLAEQGKGKDGDGWDTLRLRLPPTLHESWKAHLDTHSGDEVQAFAVALGLDPADLPT